MKTRVPADLLALVLIILLFTRAASAKLAFDTEILDIAPRSVDHLLLIDLDRDGDLDIVAAEALGGDDIFDEHPIFAYRNDGTGRFKDFTRKKIPKSATTQDHSQPTMVIADFNHDGRDDVFFGATLADDPSITKAQGLLLLQRKKPKLRNVTARALPGLAGNFTFHINVGDVDGDGDLDIFRQNSCCIDAQRASHFLLNNGKGIFTADETRIPAEFSWPAINFISSALVDVDDDGDLDLVLGGEEDTSTTLLYNDGTGFFSGAPDGSIPDKVGSSRRWVEMINQADFNGDGRDDLVLHVVKADRGSETQKDFLQILLNQGDGSFENGPRAPRLRPKAGPTGWINYVAVGDLNNDGFPELVTGMCCGKETFPRVFRNLGDGTGRFKEVRRLLKELGNDSFVPQLGDIDGDGDLDIVGASSERIVILRNRLIK